MRVGFIKTSLCLRLPVCDLATAVGTYDAFGLNRDCGGLGVCVWNMEKGNHCICDGQNVTVSMVNAKGWKKGQTCCPPDSVAKCKARYNSGSAADSFSASPAAKTAQLSNVTEQATVKGAFVNGYHKGYVEGRDRTEETLNSTELGEMDVATKAESVKQKAVTMDEGPSNSQAEKDAEAKMAKAAKLKPKPTSWFKRIVSALLLLQILL